MSLLLIRRTCTRLVVVTVTLLGIVGIGRVPAFAAGATFFAAPSTSGTADCSSAANACTLTSAIAATTDGDTVILAGGTYANTHVTISHGITLSPASGATPVLDGGGTDDVIHVHSNDLVTIDGLTAQNAGNGHSGVYNDDEGNVALVGATLTGNGYGLYSTAPAVVTDSTLSGNTGDGLFTDSTATVTGSTFSGDGEGIEANGTVTVTDSTLSGNTTFGLDVPGTVTLTDSTLSGNAESGIFVANGGTVSAGADIVAGNQPSDCGGPSPIVDHGYDIDGDGSCGFDAASSISDSASIAGSLGPLQNNGGPTKTIALTPSSPAIELVTGPLSGGGKVCGTPDQRGYTRPSAPCDAGAFETNPRLATADVELITSPAGGASVGQTVTLTADVAGAESDPTGTVRFTADGGTVSGCGSVAISSGSAECVTSSLGAGTYDLRAHYSGDLDYAAGSDEIPTYVVAKGQSTTAVAVTASSLSATVSPVAPATATPTGSVTFSVDGSPVGSAPLSSGVATLSHVSSGAHSVSATYNGDSQYSSSVGATATTNPTITSHVTSAHPRTSYGWYRSAVTVTFSCTPGSSALTHPCPSPVKVSSNGADQSVAKTISDTDGGTATDTVSPINIDKLSPTVKVVGVKSGHTYPKAPHPTCTATDSLSGIAGGCTVTSKKTKHGKTTTVAYTATATNKAGTSATVKGTYTIKK